MMHALPLVCLCVLTRSGAASADGPGPEVIKVEQDGDVILPCSRGNKQNMESGFFHWKKEKKEVFFYENGDYYKDHDGQDEQFKGRVSYFQDQLKHGNASIVIRNTKMEDAGTYTCAFPRIQTPETYYIELVVGAVLKDRSGENIPGAAPKPSVTSFDESKDWSLLQCEAHGNPRPEVKWEDSSGNQVAADEPELSERGSSFYVKLKVTVRKTDRYRCVATQNTINHQTHADTTVYIYGGVQEPVVTILDQTKDWSFLQCVVRGASPELRVEWEDSSGKTLLAHKPTFPVRGGYDIVLNITVTQTDRYRCVATDKTNKRTQTEIYVHISGSSTGWIIAVVAVLVTLLLVGVVLVVLVSKGCISLKSKKSSTDKKKDTEETDSFTGGGLVS